MGGQAESLHHTWLVGSAIYEADFQPAMCFLTCDPGRRPTDLVLPRASMSEPVGLRVAYSGLGLGFWISLGVSSFSRLELWVDDVLSLWGCSH